MSRIAVFLVAILGLAAAGPAVVRSKKDIEDFINYLERIKKGNSEQPLIQGRSGTAFVAHSEETSGRYQGDIVLDDIDYEMMLGAFVMGRNAYATSSITTWPDKTVIFEFGANEFTKEQEAAIWAAIKDIEAHTCVKFRYREQSDAVYALLTGVTNGCYAHIGYRRSRGPHTMNLGRSTVGTGCFIHATIVHEFMHILGFTHMHATAERDAFVDIIEENISPGNEHNFDVYDVTKIKNYSIPYDYVSCMHYSSNSFTRNGDPTIVAKKNFSGQMGQRNFVTNSDWLRINRHYDCPGAWN